MEKIKIKNGCYYAYRIGGYEKISNFIINIKHTLHYKNKRKRQITLINGDFETEPFIIESKNMTNARTFQSLCLDMGNFIFEGNTIDMKEIWKLEFAKNVDEPEVYLIDEVGYIREHKTWLFENIAIRKKRVIFPDNNGVFWLKDNYGLELFQMVKQMPKLEVPEDEYDLASHLKIVEDTLNRNLGGFKGTLLIGYIVATIYSMHILKKFDSFPILFAYGKYQSGKSVYCKLLMNFFGLDKKSAISAQESSQTGVSRFLSYFSFLPIWIEEYRNSEKIMGSSSFFRNVYDKTGSMKAKKEEFGIREVELKGHLLLSGEEMPLDTALRSRCIPVNLSSKERDNKLYSQVLNLSKNFSKITFSLIRQFDKESSIEYLKIVNELKDFYLNEKIEDRQAEVFATVVAGRKFLDRYVPYNSRFEKWMLNLVQKENKRREEESPVTVFWETIESLISKEEIKKFHYIELDKKTGLAYVWFAGLFAEYEKGIRLRKNISFTRQTILDQMSEESYFVAKNKSKRINGQTRTCIILDYKKCPKNIKVIASSKDNPIFDGM